MGTAGDKCHADDVTGMSPELAVPEEALGAAAYTDRAGGAGSTHTSSQNLIVLILQQP